MRKLTFILCLVFGVVLSSCQKVVFDDEEPEIEAGKIRLTLNVNQFDMLDFSSMPSRSQDIANLCTHICLGVYQNGERTKQVNQKSTDKDYGTLSVDLSEGTYQLVIIAHNSSSNPTMTNPEKVTFGTGLGDTFTWTQAVNLDKNTKMDIKMSRAVAKFRLVTTDNIPSNVKSMKFYYTGGSSTINALTGIGNVNSKQTEVVNVTDDMAGKPGTFEVYSFPKDDENILNMTITALDANGETLFQHVFESVPISRNKITQYTGEFFTDGGTSESKNYSIIGLTTDDEWSSISKTF